jgi:hypothetical protein
VDTVIIFSNEYLLIRLNVVPPRNLFIDSDHEHDTRIRTFAIGWTFVAILLLFGSGIAGAAIMITQLVKEGNVYNWGHVTTLYVLIFYSNNQYRLFPILTMLSAFVFFFGRLYGDKRSN